ncbi:MAG: hypothetical protein MK101_04525 [Phycisphaerales bacterium]|nr:hypothetical protein [Phycisphaerales bacterium]
MDIADLIAIAVVGMSVLAPTLAKLKKGAAPTGKAPSAGGSATGIKVPRRAPGQAPVGTGVQGATTRTRTITPNQPRPPRTNPEPAAPQVAKRPTSAAVRESPPAATPVPDTPAPTPPATGSASSQAKGRSRAWTRLQEAVVYREMLGRPKALERGDD